MQPPLSTRAQPRRRIPLLVALVALLAPLGLTAPAAQADRCDARSRNSRTFRTSPSYGPGHAPHHLRHHRGGNSHRKHISAPPGFYKKIHRPAVYRTVYDACGQAHRVLVRAARYDRVWVSNRRNRW